MADIITPEELAELVESGAIVTEQKDPTKISGWESLVAQLTRIAEANEQLLKKQDEQIKGTLEKIADVLKRKNVDTTPLISLLGDIKNNTEQRPDNTDLRFVMVRKSSDKLLDYVDVIRKPESKIIN